MVPRSWEREGSLALAVASEIEGGRPGPIAGGTEDRSLCAMVCVWGGGGVWALKEAEEVSGRC